MLPNAYPARFIGLSRTVVVWLAILTVVALAVALPWALWLSPPDYQQKDTIRIMYVHVPSAWIGLMAYVLMAACALVSLIWKKPLADYLARAIAPIGAVFTLLCLVTGSLWGRPMWGTWWEWDARMTSMLVLLFLYLGYMALSNAFDDFTRGTRAAALLCVVGVINIPVIKFSVEWWNTLHQTTTVFKKQGPSMAPEQLTALLLMALAFHLLFALLVLVRTETEATNARLRSLGALGTD
ncbi:heme ABC transporter permease [Phaeovibrio sulfidiphilus]|uniref:Heme exporter protein C n=1 Tax=Phaeovibrio sulfidiphilus TaxID=1220600 RepID=A0A8J6YVU9_9PROT|nr:heme ABC transporter permease [Phaeovibrio sulfidiphilus]MBE1237364.1 heme ABC transporter permease [Phaeovibrio sulfidiphilus]